MSTSWPVSFRHLSVAPTFTLMPRTVKARSCRGSRIARSVITAQLSLRVYNVPMSLTDLSGYLSEFEPPPTAGLLDANGWLSEPAVCLASVSLKLLAAGNTGPDGIDAALQRLMATGPWPTFSVERSDTASLHVVWRNYEDESGVDLLLASADGVHRLSSLEGHFSWPGLSWEECSKIASRVSNLTPAEALIPLPLRRRQARADRREGVDPCAVRTGCGPGPLVHRATDRRGRLARPTRPARTGVG